jgi:hypothetical protein
MEGKVERKKSGEMKTLLLCMLMLWKKKALDLVKANLTVT